MDIGGKLIKLRCEMRNEGIDTYIVTKSDPHQSEYAEPHWDSVKFISGFTGSAGVVVVTANAAGLWTDGRYYLQAESELSDSEFLLHRASDKNVKNFIDHAAEITGRSGLIGFDGRTVSVSQYKSLLEKTAGKNISIATGVDLIGRIWEDRVPPGASPVFVHEPRFAGASSESKLNQVRKQMAERGADAYLLSSLDDVAWLTNLRGRDLAYSCTFPAYMIIEADSAALFVDPIKLNGVALCGAFTIKDYGDIDAYIKNIPSDKKIALCPKKTSCGLSNAAAGHEIIEIEEDFTALPKAKKNETEIINLRNANVRDGVSFTRFIKWIKETRGATEYEAGLKLRSLRSQNENYIGESFNPIVAYMGNAAVVHYGADEKTSAVIGPGILLVDSGGQYLDGTTDMTRTVCKDEPSAEFKKHYTLVLKGHIALASAVFPRGVTGHRLDALARAPLWQNGLDYDHGTGHGIGCCLGVHEGPQSIAAKPNDTALEEGMLVSNEPGVYFAGRYGIRIENTLLVKKHPMAESENYLCFETVSFAPFDPLALDHDLLSGPELRWLGHYNERVYETLRPFLSDEESNWLFGELNKFNLPGSQ